MSKEDIKLIVATHSNIKHKTMLSDSLSNLPPAFAITCEFDPLRDTGRHYAKKLTEAKIPTIHKGMLHCIPGLLNEKDRTELYNEIAKEVNKATQD